MTTATPLPARNQGDGIDTSPPAVVGVVGGGTCNTVHVIGAEKQPCAAAKTGATRDDRSGVDTGAARTKLLTIEKGSANESSCASLKTATARNTRFGVDTDSAEEQFSHALAKIGTTRNKQLGADIDLNGPSARENAVVEEPMFHRYQEQSGGEITVLQHEQRRELEPTAAEAELDETTVKDDVTTVLINEAHAEGGGEMGSTRSRPPSELFDSLDLSVS